MDITKVTQVPRTLIVFECGKDAEPGLMRSLADILNKFEMQNSIVCRELNISELDEKQMNEKGWFRKGKAL